LNDILAVALTCQAIGEKAIEPKVWRDLRSVLETLDGEGLTAWAEKRLSPGDAAQVARRIELLPEAGEKMETWSQRGISVITEFDGRYPRKWKETLGDRHPPVVYVAGNPSLLNADAIAIVGSRDVDDAGNEFTARISEEAVRLSYAVASGGARGVDQTAMRAAFEAGGASVGVLADSLLKAASDPELDSGSICLLSPYSPSAGFSVGNAMGRNKLVYALSEAAVIVASAHGSGGTWAGAVEALEKNLCKVIVREGTEGSSALIAKGGHPIKDASTLAKLLNDERSPQGRLL
jgi:predicted Rossmann fold nucleotide-binding protein DprA/Smf involved in DNA uptake